MAARGDATSNNRAASGRARPGEGSAEEEEEEEARMKEEKTTEQLWEGEMSDLLGLYTSMSSRSSVLKDALGPSVLARTFSTRPLSEPRKTTV